MGFKSWTKGTQKGLRVYTPSINELSRILEVLSSDGQWGSLREFLISIEQSKGKRHILPYSRNIEIRKYRGSKSLNATLTIAQHNSSTQGYITIPSDTWLFPIVEEHMNKDFHIEYIVGKHNDIVILPVRFRGFDIREQRDKELTKMENKVIRKYKMVPKELNKIGLYFELKEVEFIKNQQHLKPHHRFPYIYSRIPNIRKNKRKSDIVCDIDVSNNKGNFVKFVEVKAVYGMPPKEFYFTRNEYKSREKCKKNNWKYEIIVYYHVGKTIVKRDVIQETKKLKITPVTYLCSYK